MSLSPLEAFRKPPTASEFAREAALRNRKFAFIAAALAVLCGLSMVAVEAGSFVLPIVLLVLVTVSYMTWRYSQTVLFFTFAAVCLVEIFQTGFSDAVTDRIPFFWNVNTIIQTYGNVNFKAVPFNLFEVFLVSAGICSLMKAVYWRNASIRLGPLFTPIAAYLAFVVMGFVIGMATGGDFKIALQETRAQFYFLIAYLMALNLVKERRHVTALCWITVVCIGLKGILYTFRRYVTLSGQPLPDQGVGSHEEAFLFDAFVLLLASFALCKVYPRMQAVMWALVPLVIAGNLATNRRAATAALVVAIPVLIVASYRALPRRRTVAAVVGIVLAIVSPIYYQAFKNSNSMWAQPARAIRSHFQPDARDLSSNMYRDAEDANIMATIKSKPVLGYGYGKRFLHVVPIADISNLYDWWDILPHNQILWVWMRVGTIGFWFFWMMIVSITLYLCYTLRDEGTDDHTKAVALFALVLVGVLLMFGLLDLQLSNFRDMLFTGFWIGIVVAMKGFPREDGPAAEPAAEPAAAAVSARAARSGRGLGRT